MKTLVNYSKRPYIYAMLLTVGVALLFTIVHTYGVRSFFMAGLSLYSLLLFELFSTKYYAEHLMDQYDLAHRSRRHRRAQMVHHLLMPTVLFTSLLFFVFVNSQSSRAFVLLVVLLSLALFTVLFTNIKAYYENKLRLEHKTANIYDVISIISAFMAGYSIVNFVPLVGVNSIVTGIILAVLALILGYLTLSRYQLLNFNSYGLLMLFVLGVLFSNLLLNSLHISSLAQGMTVAFLTYYFTVIINHLEEKSLNLQVIIEYLAVLALYYVIILLGFI